jgi:hypothetical protein
MKTSWLLTASLIPVAARLGDVPTKKLQPINTHQEKETPSNNMHEYLDYLSKSSSSTKNNRRTLLDDTGNTPSASPTTSSKDKKNDDDESKSSAEDFVISLLTIGGLGIGVYCIYESYKNGECKPDERAEHIKNGRNPADYGL